MPSSFRRRVLSFSFMAGASFAAPFSLNAQTASPPTSGSAPAPGGSATPGSASTNATIAASLRTIPSTPSGTPPSTDYNLQLQWNESQRGVTLTYANPSANALTIQGVQSTGNLFVVSFPSSIPAGGSGSIDVVYLAQAGTQADSDIVRLLTSDGLKLLRIAHGRAAVASFDKQVLSWQIGEALTPKSATLSLLNGVQAVSVNSFDGSTATVTQESTGTFLVTVTPGSTAVPDKFPVVVILSPAVPNTTPVISCIIGPSN
jgi:hypothetical protein